MEVSFIIPVHNCLALTQACLRSLQATVPPGLKHEIIIVDDASTDSTRDWLETITGRPHGAIRALRNDTNSGFGHTCNHGARSAGGRILVFLNNDLVLLPGWLEPLLALARRPRTGLVGNVQLNAASGAIDHTGLTFDHKGKPAHLTDRPWRARLTGVRPVVAATGACFAIRADAWHALGGFDLSFVNGSEDVDLCLRARADGLVNYVALRSVVRHHISQSPGRKLRDEQNTRRLTNLWHETIVGHALRPMCAALLSVAWHEPRNYPDPALARDAFLWRCGLLFRPSLRLLVAADALLAVEQERWSGILDHAEPRPVEEIAWQLFEPAIERPPVI